MSAPAPVRGAQIPRGDREGNHTEVHEVSPRERPRRRLRIEARDDHGCAFTGELFQRLLQAGTAFARIPRNEPGAIARDDDLVRPRERREPERPRDAAHGLGRCFPEADGADRE